MLRPVSLGLKRKSAFVFVCVVFGNPTPTSQSSLSFSRPNSGLCPHIGFQGFHFLRLALELGFSVREQPMELAAGSQKEDHGFVQIPFCLRLFRGLVGLGHAIRHGCSNHPPGLAEAFFVWKPLDARRRGLSRLRGVQPGAVLRL